MEWATVVGTMWKAFVLAYAIFVIWSCLKWIRMLQTSRFTVRDWLGSLGLAMGAASAALFAWFWIYLWIERRLIAHGSSLWLYYYTGFCLAAVGLTLGLVGRDWVRRSSTIVSLVMSFQWMGRMVIGRKVEFLITIAMFVSLALGGIIALVGRLFFRRLAGDVPRQNSIGT